MPAPFSLSLGLNDVLGGSDSWSWLSYSRRSSRIDLLSRRTLRVLRWSHTSILSEVQIQATVLQLCNQEQDRERKKWCSEQIKDTDIDEAGGHADDITAIIDTPGNGIEEPEEDEVARDAEVVLCDVEALGGCEAVSEEGC